MQARQPRIITTLHINQLQLRVQMLHLAIRLLTRAVDATRRDIDRLMGADAPSTPTDGEEARP